MGEPSDDPPHPPGAAGEKDQRLPATRPRAGVSRVDDREDGDAGLCLKSEPDRVSEILALFGQFGFGPAPSPLGEKLTSEHISTLLDIDRQRIGFERASEKEHRWLHLAVLVLFCGFVLLLVAILLSSGNDQLTEKVLLGIISLVAGAAGGYGLARGPGSD